MKHVITLAFCAALLFSCGSGGRQKQQPVATNVPPKTYTYEVVASYPHLTSSYTQGLQFIDGVMWEGTGEYGHSKLQTIDLETGRADVIASLPRTEFGEGITVLGDKVYQLTWQNRTMHVYDRATGKRLRNIPYEGEGWGLTSDGERLYMSDGSSVIRIIDPQTYKRTGSISVLYEGKSVPYLNELEWIGGRIWANVYTLDQIVIIDPATGNVEGLLDLTGILPEEEIYASTDVLNGIAYDAERDRIFVTGKNWSRIFEIKIIEK